MYSNDKPYDLTWLANELNSHVFVQILRFDRNYRPYRVIQERGAMNICQKQDYEPPVPKEKQEYSDKSSKS